MKNKIFLLFIILVSQEVYSQQEKDRICSSNRHVEECIQLKRGNPQVSCVYAQDAVECAQRLRNGTADFGVFTAENAYHIASLDWDDMSVIKEIRHMSRLREEFDYSAVVIVRSDHTGGVENLRGTDFCHPGLHYGRPNRWSERFLKTFERTIIRANCTKDEKSASEAEVAGLSEFFNAGCRPGAWSNVEDENVILKDKYTNLCSLCDNPLNCTYNNHGHTGALDCVTKSSNAITYVALEEAKNYFSAKPELSSQFSFLCRNGTLQSISKAEPCVWLSQPWNVVVARGLKTVSLQTNLPIWINSEDQWASGLRRMILPDNSQLHPVKNLISLKDYFRSKSRPIPIETDEQCPTPIRWCTRSEGELDKCNVIKMAALTTGIRPQITCNRPRSDSVTCLSEVSSGRADFVGIDSNFGYIARNPNNLSAVLFEETEPEKRSSIVVVIKEKDSESIKRFEDLRGKKACFPEFGGIASIAFISVGKGRGIFKREECEFGPLLGGFFGDSCLPGSLSLFHDHTGKSPASLCSLCQTKAVPLHLPITPLKDPVDTEYDDENTEATPEGADEITPIPFIPNREVDCAASSTNRYYGTRGSLSCLTEMGDVAVLEHQNLEKHAKALNLDEDNFRILCRNGSLAAYPGFDVDAGCFLTTIVDGEVVVNRKHGKAATVVNVLMSLDKYFQHDPDFKMYNIFANETNLLFEDSANGLVSPNSADLGESVENYIQLFDDVENCMSETDAANSIVVNFLLTISLVIYTIFFVNDS